MSRTVLRASFRSRAIALIFRFCTKYARRTLAIVSTVTIPLLTSGANHALGAGLPPGGGVKIGCRSPPERGQNCTPLHIFLGFCHVWGRSRKGKNVVRQVTAKKRYARAL